MSPQCANDSRRALVLKAGKQNGIDFLEIASDDQRTLAVNFLLPITGPTLTPDNVRIEGGVRVRNIAVTATTAMANVLTVTVNVAGDFSTYTLRLVTSPTNAAPPAGYDPQLSATTFSFKAACDTDFDCRPAPAQAPEPEAPSSGNYLAKDYSSFRSLMLDRLSLSLPGWTERNPADLQIALVEVLAYTADHLSYYQDAVATEAYLGTARRRVSVRRHARLLNYTLHEGCNARAWIQMDVQPGSAADGYLLPSGSAVLAQGVTSFETMQDLLLRASNSAMSFYTWGSSACTLPAGSTSATLRNRSGAPALSLQPGDFLLFEEVLSPETGSPADADPAHRHVVRLTTVTNGVDPLDGLPAIAIAWSALDALPFDLCLTASITPADGAPQITEISMVRGNLVLADHGLTLSAEALPTVTDSYSPRLPRPNLTFRSGYVPGVAASQASEQDVRTALPAISLNVGGQPWTARRDLLSSGRFDRDFVVETERDGSSSLRFGDGIDGAQPFPGSAVTATYRVGNGRAGNVGADVLTQVVSARAGITKVRNPLPASGGTDPEPLDNARLFAPQSFRTQQRAVTPDDYAQAAMRHPQVRTATARFRWTGSWSTVFVTVVRKDGLDVDGDQAFESSVADFLEPYRMAGYDLEIGGPVNVPLDIALNVCVAPGYFQSDVHDRLQREFSAFFNRSNFSFGQPVYLSQVYERAMRVAGIASVDVVRFQRYGKPAADELGFGAIRMEQLEVARLDNDPSLPENGMIDFVVAGGL